MWLDVVEETMAHYQEFGRPTSVEKWVPEYYRDWLSFVKQKEREKLERKGRTPESFEPLGRGQEEDNDAWMQWFEYVDMLNDMVRPADDDDED